MGKEAKQAGQGKTTQARLEALSEGDGTPLEGAREKKDITDSALEKGLQGKYGRQRRGRKMSCWETSQKAPSMVQMRNYQGFKPSSDGGCVEKGWRDLENKIDKTWCNHEHELEVYQPAAIHRNHPFLFAGGKPS